MIDILYYAMLKCFKEYQDIINNYTNHKIIQKPEDFNKLLYEKMEKYNIGLNEVAYINIYIRLCYIYFNNYDRSKIIKQIKQVKTNLRNNNKNDILVYQ
jgi:uncharacterized protein YpuA (DUF1002 family)